jgi:hypothetical protein
MIKVISFLYRRIAMRRYKKGAPFKKTHYPSADQIANNDIENPLHPVATHCNAALQKRSPPSKKRIIDLPTKSPTTILKNLFTP